ncbi:MAG: DUF4303 domain-containing protein [Anaerolineae bacterium]|nr:DUF4303 domain-containing protein [Anaerolineae bacterium]
MGADYFTTLRTAVRAASEKAFTQIRENHPDEEFYAFALNTDDSVLTAVECANSEEGFQRAVKRFAYTDPADLSYLRWNVPEWAYESIATEFSPAVHQALNGAERSHIEESLGFVAFRERVHQTMIEALQDLEANHFFGTGNVREKITVFVSISDSDLAERLENVSAQKLNPVSVYERFLARYSLDQFN